MANQSCRTKISPSSVPTHLVHSVHVTSAKRGEQRAATPQRELAAPICMFTKDPSGSPLERLQEKGDRIWTPPPTPPRGGRQGQGHSGKATLRHKSLRHRIGGGEKPRVQLGHRERYPWAVLDRVRPVARGSIYPAGDTLPETLLNVFHLTPGCLDRSE